MKTKTTKCFTLFLAILMIVLLSFLVGCESVNKRIAGRWKDDDNGYILYLEENGDNVTFELHGYRGGLIIKGNGSIYEETPEGWSYPRTVVKISSQFFSWELGCSRRDNGEIYRLYEYRIEFYRDN